MIRADTFKNDAALAQTCAQDPRPPSRFLRALGHVEEEGGGEEEQDESESCPGTPKSISTTGTPAGATRSQRPSVHSQYAPTQGMYVPGPASSRMNTGRSTLRSSRPKELGNVGEEWTGPRWTGQERGPEHGDSPNDVSDEVLAAQEKIRQDWHKKLASETDWDKVKSPKHSLRPGGAGRPGARDKLLDSAVASGRPLKSASPSAASSAVPSPRDRTYRGGPGPPLPGGAGPPLPGAGPPLPGGAGPPLPGRG